MVEIGTFLDLFILLTMVKYPKMTCFISGVRGGEERGGVGRDLAGYYWFRLRLELR